MGLLVAVVALAIPAAADIAPPAFERAGFDAEAALKRGERALAESGYRDVLLEGWMLLGELERAEGHPDLARRALQHAVGASAEVSRPRRALASLLLETGEAAEAVTLLTREVARDRADPGARRLLAQALIAAGQPEQAVQELVEAHAALPGDFEIAYALASGYLRLRKIDEAERLFAEIAKARPLPVTYVLIGRTYRDAREFARAGTALEKALALDPGTRRAHYYLGTTAGMAIPPRFDDAIREFEAELAQSPDDPLSHLYLGMALAEQHRCAEAMPHLCRAPQKDEEVLFFVGRCQLALDRPAEAAAALTEALARGQGREADEGRLMSLHYQLALALRRTGAEREAAVHFAEAERHSARRTDAERERLSDYLSGSLEREKPDVAAAAPVESPLAALSAPARVALRARVTAALARAYMNMGIMHAQASRFSRAAELLEEAAALDPDFPQVQYSLGVAYFNAGRHDRAAAALTRAAAKAPADPAIRRMLALSEQLAAHPAEPQP
jgi:tetratricopeptide (TPR) repeat protein